MFTVKIDTLLNSPNIYYNMIKYVICYINYPYRIKYQISLISAFADTAAVQCDEEKGIFVSHDHSTNITNLINYIFSYSLILCTLRNNVMLNHKFDLR